MPRTIDWADLKEGAFFSVPKMNQDWVHTLAAYTPPDYIYTLRKGKFYNIANPDTPFMDHCSSPGYRHSGVQIKQPVLVYENETLPVDKLLRSHSQRVNGTTGSDPEIFVVRGKAKKSLLPAFKYLPTKEVGRKENQKRGNRPGNLGGENYAFAYRDGFAGECYVYPGSCHGYQINYIRAGLNEVLNAALKFDRTAELTIQNTFTIPAITMKEGTDEDVALGCKPSLNAYDDVPILPASSRNFLLRFAGGHVHLGIGLLREEKARKLVRACDVIAAIPAVAIFASIDTPIRRQFYGRAGEYRRPQHGLEYRVLSNAWLAAPEITHLILNLVRCGLKVGASNYQSYLGIEDQEVRDIINFCDVKAARKYVLEHLEMFNILLEGDGVTRTPSTEKAFKTIIEGGIEALKPTFEDIKTNWLLNSSEWVGESNGMRASWRYLCAQQPTK